MKYGKEYAKKVFELIPEANFVAVDEDNDCEWYSERPDVGGDSWWPANRKSRCGSIGKAECDDWEESLIAREDVYE